jgi:RNA polymerase sigma factor (TIGR02999 family)
LELINPMMGDARERPTSAPVTDWLLAWRGGDAAALDQLVPVVMHELRRLARRYLRGERPDHTLQTTALVNEAYLRLVDLDRVQWQDRTHFFAMSARLMRQILVDHARARRAHKREGHLLAEPLTDNIPAREPGADLVAIDDALQALTAFDERKGRVVELRFFGGLTVEETAAALGVSVETVARDWRFAKVWLLREMTTHG